MKPSAGHRSIVCLVVCLAALAATACGAAATTKHFAHALHQTTAPVRTKSVDVGIAGLTGAFIEADYPVSASASQNERARTSAIHEATQGRYAFDEAIAYLEESPRAANMIKRIAAADGMMLVVINHNCRDGQSMGMGWKSIVFWDPNCAYRSAQGANSPSVILLHEMVHTLHLFEDPEAFMNYGSQKSTLFDDNEERRTILYGEDPVERQLGEVVRRNHSGGTPFIVHDPTVH